MRVKGLLFDKDGTLIDFNHTWLPVYREAARYLATHSALDVSAEYLLAAGGYLQETDSWQADSLLAAGSNSQILSLWQQLTGLVLEGELLTGVNRILSAGSHRYRALVADLPAYLSALGRKGYKTGVATMDDEAHARHALEILGADSAVDFVCGADSGFGLKPQAGMLEAFAEHCALLARHIAMIGDSPRDLQMGLNAGALLRVGVLTGASSREALEPFASHILPSINELPALLATLE